jgi:hypothetical protein
MHRLEIRSRPLAATLVAALALGGCAASDDFDYLHIGGDRELAKGEVAWMAATAIYENDTGRFVTQEAVWDSSNPAVVAITNVVPVVLAEAVAQPAAGRITALTEGTSEITATWQGKTARITVTVGPARRVSLVLAPDAPTLTLPAEGAEPVTVPLSVATVIWTDAELPPGDGETIVWSSSNGDVATVAADTGIVTPVAEGKATITARLQLPDADEQLVTVATGSVEVTVAPPPSPPPPAA